MLICSFGEIHPRTIWTPENLTLRESLLKLHPYLSRPEMSMRRFKLESTHGHRGNCSTCCTSIMGSRLDIPWLLSDESHMQVPSYLSVKVKQYLQTEIEERNGHQLLFKNEKNIKECPKPRSRRTSTRLFKQRANNTKRFIRGLVKRAGAESEGRRLGARTRRSGRAIAAGK